MHWLSTLHLKSILYAIVLLLVGWILAKRFGNLAQKYGEQKLSYHFASLTRRMVFYVIFLGFLISALQQLGFNLSVLIGAAGIFTVAISFASQTAASNLISGIFMIFERPFSLGDSIVVKGISGTIEAIDLLSTKLRTADNCIIRIPNETMNKSEITNLSYFPTRRIDLIIGIGYENDIGKARKAFIDTANICPGVLDTPEPSVLINHFADSNIELKCMVWVNRADYVNVKSQLQEMIKTRFDQDNIEIPYPQLTIRRAE